MVPNLAPKSGTSSVPKIGFGRYSQTDQSQARSSHRRRARMRARSYSEQASHFLGPLSVPALGVGFRPHFRGRIPPLISGTIFHICIAPSGPGLGSHSVPKCGDNSRPKKIKIFQTNSSLAYHKNIAWLIKKRASCTPKLYFPEGGI